MVGFSQGGCLAAVLAALKERDGGRAPLPDLKAAVVLCGFAPKDPEFSQILKVLRHMRLRHMRLRLRLCRVSRAAVRHRSRVWGARG